MIGTIAFKELTEWHRDSRLRILSALLIVIMATVIVLGWQNSRQLSVEQNAAQAQSYEQWLEQGNKNPHFSAHFGQYVFKPQSPLAFLDPGVDRFSGSMVWIEAHKQNEFRYRPARDATALARFTQLSLAAVLQWLVPLFIILLGFSAFSAEREQKTLPLLASAGVRPFQLLMGKSLGLMAALAILVLPAFASFVVAGGLGDQDGQSARAAGMALGYLLYLIGFTALTLAVSALAKQSSRALLILLVFWVLNSFVMPRVLNDWARSLYPTPSQAEFQNQIRADLKAAGYSGHGGTSPAYEALKARVLKQYGVSRLEDLPVNFTGIGLQAGEENGNRVFDKRYGELWRLYDAQEAFQSQAGLLFPLLALKPLSMGFAGTDQSHHQNFARAAETYRRMAQRVMNDAITQNPQFKDYSMLSGRELWEKVPPFRYAPPSALQEWQQQSANLIRLSLWAGAMLAFAIFATRRLKVV
jgi:ABC-2 type transport system permease protein